MPAAVPVRGAGQFPLNFPLGCGPGPDPPQLPPWVWVWTRFPSTSPLGCGPGPDPPQLPLECGPGPDPPQLSPWLWAWRPGDACLVLWGCLPSLGSAWLVLGGAYLVPGGDCLVPRGMPAWSWRVVSQHALSQTLPMNRITDACENITLAQLCCGR